MDYQFLNNEYHTWFRYNDHNFKTLEHFSEFLKTISTCGNTYHSRVSKSLNDFKEELSNAEITTTWSRTLHHFSDIYDERLKQLKNDITYLNNDLLSPILNYCSQAQKLNKETFKRFNEMNTGVMENKTKLEAIKSTFLTTSKLLLNWEDKVKEPKYDESTYKKKVEQIQKLQASVDSDKTKYKSELERINKHLASSEVVYDSVISVFQLEEHKRFNLLKDVFEKWIAFLTSKREMWGEFTSSWECSTRTLNINLDMKTYKNYFDYTYQKIEKRFMLESFYDYHTFIKEKKAVVNPIAGFSEEQMENIEWESIIKEEISKSNNYISNATATVSKGKLRKRQESSSDPRPKNEEWNFWIEFILFSHSSVKTDDVEKIKENIGKDVRYAREFIQCWLYHYKKNIFLTISSMDNLGHWCDLLWVIMTHTQSNPQIFDWNFPIIFFAEKTIYINPENMFSKCYLCKLLSENSILSQKSFWKTWINQKIFSVIDKKIYEEIEKRYWCKKLESNNILSKMKNLFGNSKMKDNQAIEMEMWYADIYNELLPGVSAGIIENYIQHFSNFNFNVSDSIEWISHLSREYKLPNDYLMYFIAEWNTNIYTIKNHNAMLQDIEHKVDYNSHVFYWNLRKNLNKYDVQFNVIAHSLRYWSLEDIRNTLCVNKNYYSRLRKHVYKNILLKHHDMPMKTRLNIWKNILDYNNIKKRYDYFSIVEEIKTETESNVRSIIEMDVARTPLDKDVAENRKKIMNILKALDRKCAEFSYSQGMNYIVAFLLKLTDNEEETFYFFCALLFSTEYGQLFHNDWEMLKTYFYIFDKLLNIHLPELYFYLKNNNIYVSYFASPWLITLFTNAFQYIHAKEKPKVLLRIWDVFLWNKWNSILKIALSLVKHYESKLLTLTFEDIWHFWTNDIIKSEFFQNQNFETLMFITINIKINRRLISNIENVCCLKKKLQLQDEHEKEKKKKKKRKGRKGEDNEENKEGES